MADFAPGDVLIGGPAGYVEHIRGDGTHVGHIPASDDNPHTPNPLRVNGIAFDSQGEAYFALGDPNGTADHDPHDIAIVPAVVPGPPERLAVLVARASHTLELWLLDLDGTLLAKQTGLATDAGWTRDRHARLVVACNGRTVYYTDQMRTIFRWDLAEAAQLPQYAQLELGSPYLYGDLALADNGDVLAAMSAGGVGPRNALALASDGQWTDQLNPADGIHRVYKRSLVDGSDLLSHVVSLTPEGANLPVTALGVYYSVCPPAQVAEVQAFTGELGTGSSQLMAFSLGSDPSPDLRFGVHSLAILNGASVPRSWTNDVAALGAGRVRLDIRFEGTPIVDEFATTLDPAWTWIREPVGDWSLTPDPGFLRINTEPGDIAAGDAPLLLRSFAGGDFEITTLVTMAPSQDYQQAGLVVYSDDANHIHLTYGHFGAVGFEFGQQADVDYQSAQSFPTLNGTTVELKITRNGQHYAGWWREGNGDWAPVGTPFVVGTVFDRIGLTAFNGVGASITETNADFHSFWAHIGHVAARRLASEEEINDALNPFLTAMGTYLPAVAPLAVLGGGILSIYGDFAPGNESSSYITEFATRAALIARKLAAVGVRSFEIWNEPNVPLSPNEVDSNPEYVPGAVDFASLVFHAAQAIRLALPQVPVTIVTGGVYVDDASFEAGKTYLMAVFPQPGGGWDHIGLHTYQSPGNLGSNLDQLYGELGSPTFWITEVGITRACQNETCSDPTSGEAQDLALPSLYEVIVDRFTPGVGFHPRSVAAAFWYTHHRQFHRPRGENDPVEILKYDWGLMDFNSETGEIVQHWPA